MRDEVMRHLTELRRRYRRVRALDAFLEAAFGLTAAVAALLLVDRLAFEFGLARAHVTTSAAIALAFGSALLLAALAALLDGSTRRATAAAIAWRADRALALDERFLTSVEMAADGARSEFAPALFTQAAEAMRGMDVRKIFPPSPVGYRWGILLALAAGTVLAAFGPRAAAPPYADFVVTPERGPAPLLVAFEDASQGRIAEWDWDFGDGKTSGEPSPSHRFEQPGRYLVRLIVRGPGGHAERTALIEAVDPTLPVAEFDAEPMKGRAPLAVAFTNRSHRGEVNYWTFGDGAVAAERNPSHRYEQPGTYDVTLEARNAMGRSTRTKRIRVIGPDAPMADFRAMPRKGPAPLMVDFEDNSTGRISEWEWDLGDLSLGKDRIRRERMPSHEYRMPGKYTVRLKVKGPGGEDELVRVNYIEVTAEGEGGGGGGGKSQSDKDKKKGGGGGPPGGRAAGTQEGRLFGDPAERPKAEFKDESVKAQAREGERVEKVKSVYGKGREGGRGEDLDYSKAFGEYERAAEDAMNREHIPPSLRAYVKRYFEEIRPK